MSTTSSHHAGSEPSRDQLLKQRDELLAAVKHYVDREHALPKHQQSPKHYINLALLASCRGNLL